MGVSIWEGKKAARVANALEEISSHQLSAESKAETAISRVTQLESTVQNINASSLNAVATTANQNLTQEQIDNARANLGLSDIDALTTGNVKYTAQTLTNEQKAQARTNIDAITAEEVNSSLSGVVKYTQPGTGEELTAAQKAQARTNIGAVSQTDVTEAISNANGVVRFDEDQTSNNAAHPITEQQQTVARKNIGLENINSLVSGSVKYDESQSLSDQEKAQARTNIGAASGSDVSNLSSSLGQLNSTVNGLSSGLGKFVKDVTKSDDNLLITYNEGTSQIALDPPGLAFDAGYVDNDNKLHLTYKNTELSNSVYTPIQLPAGSGGSGGTSTTTIVISNPTVSRTVRNGDNAYFIFTATSTNAFDDITAEWYVNNNKVSSVTQENGSEFSFNAKDYLNPSARNIVRVILTTPSEGYLNQPWTVNTIAFGLMWGSSVNPVMHYSSAMDVTVPVEVSAEANSVNTVSVTIGNHTQSKEITGAGRTSFTLNSGWFSTGVNTVTASMASSTDSTDRAEDIHFVAIWSVGATGPIVAFADTARTCDRYDTVQLEYFVYDPNNEIATFTIQEGSNTPRSFTADRTLQTYPYIAAEEGTVRFTLTCGTASATLDLTVNHSDYTLSVVTDSLVYELDPGGHSNSDVNRDSFGNMTFSQNFDWVNGGFQQDSNGASAFVVKKGNTVTLPRSIFEDADTNGKTVDISFKITNSDNYNAVAIRDMNREQTTGIILRANEGEIRLQTSAGQVFRYCEDYRTDLSVLVEPSGETNRLTTIWLDGIPSRAVKDYTEGMLVQDAGVNTVIGSEECDVWIYGIRVYNTELSIKQMTQNYVAQGNTLEEKIQRYTQNNIFVGNKITPEALHAAMPNLTIVTIAAERMTTSKEDPVPADVTILDGTNFFEVTAATSTNPINGTVFKVQGTSSAAYGRSCYNMDIDFKKDASKNKYSISEGSIPVNYLNIKVNVASSENANNICAVDWYNTFQPYLTSCRSREGCRDTVEGKPCAAFFTNTSNEAIWVSSQFVQPGETIFYAAGDLCNSKKNKEVFGQDGVGEHPTKGCIEVSGNDTAYQRFEVAPPPYDTDYDDGDGAWVTTETVDGKQKVIKHFEWRMRPDDGDLDEVRQAWDNAVTWVASTVNDSAKFKREFGNYFAVNSMLYHFLAIEYFAGYDNVSKNTFYSYDWDEAAKKYLWNINKAYDKDTIMACDNDGKPFGDYGIDYGDTVGGRSYFNAPGNPIWDNIKAAFSNELSALYNQLRNAGAWNANMLIAKWDNYQHQRPQAAMAEDAYNKYIRPYKTTGVVINGETLLYDDSYLPRMNGSKTYQRRQFLTYQTSYMDGKYGYANKGSAIMFRTNVASGYKNFTVKSYAKTYISVIIDDNRAGAQKVLTGGETTFNNISVGSNTTLYFAPEKLIQSITPLNETQNSTFTAAGASKLEQVVLGGDTTNTSWDSNTGVSIPSVVLKDLSIRNLSNYSSALNLENNVELETLDTRGTNAGAITLPSYAPLTSVQLNACTGVSAYNLNKVETFSMESGSNLTSVRMENCNAVVNAAMANYLTDATNSTQEATRRIRAINVNWTFDNLNALDKIARTWQGYNAIGGTQTTPVVTGTVSVTSLSLKKLESIHKTWGTGRLEDSLNTDTNTWSSENLIITYTNLIPYYEVEFLNEDGEPVLNRDGDPYIQYVDYEDMAYDPVAANEIDAPTYTDSTGQYIYVFSGWSNLGGLVYSNKTVRATYTRETKKYTVTWWNKVGGTKLKTLNNVAYGSEAVYDPDGSLGLPELKDEESGGVYKVFTGWDKSTGYVTGDINVYAQFASASVPSGIADFSTNAAAKLYAIARTNSASAHMSVHDHVDIQVGKDFDFSNVDSAILAEDVYFDGNTIQRTNIELFNENSPTFTMAIDYEFIEPTAGMTLVSCYVPDGQLGFRLRYSESRPDISWGDRHQGVGYGPARGIVVIRHRQGERNLYVASDNTGNGIYNDTILTVELTRAQTTVTDAKLCFGAVATGTNSYDNAGKGYIHWCKIWYADLGLHNIRELVCWPHETWRMEYIGPAKYKVNDANNSDCAATFIANAPLALKRAMHNSASTAIGWNASEMKTFMDNRLFNAMPYDYQSIIKEVRVKAKGGGSNTEPITSYCKMYLPCYAEIRSTTTEVFTQEGSTISWLADDNAADKKTKYSDIIVPSETTKTIEGDTDPTMSSVTINQGDIWAQVSSQSATTRTYFVYITAATYNSKGYVGGYLKTSTSDILPAFDGGYWVRATTYWTRTAGLYPDVPYFYAVTDTGNLQQYQSASVPSSMLTMFSI